MDKTVNVVDTYGQTDRRTTRNETIENKQETINTINRVGTVQLIIQTGSKAHLQSLSITVSFSPPFFHACLTMTTMMTMDDYK